MLTTLIKSWIKLFVICLYYTPDTYLPKVLISAPLHLSTSQSIMKSIFFIILLEIVFFSIYKWGTEAERANNFPVVLTGSLKQGKELPLAGLHVRLRDRHGSKPITVEASVRCERRGKRCFNKTYYFVCFPPYIHFHQLSWLKGVREAH